MADDGPPYRRPFRKIRQGDIAMAEFHQLRAKSGSERKGPGGQSSAAPDLPFLGPAVDFEIEIDDAVGRGQRRIVRVWSGFVIVMHQACEIDFANPDDSRLTVAPIASHEQWPEAPWKYLSENRLPGYFYLPPLVPGELEGFDQDWPESVAVLASATASSDGLVRTRRVLSLPMGRLLEFQDSLSRMYSVRGHAARQDLNDVIGKRVVDIAETGLTVPGPSMLTKVILGENEREVDEGDDELTVAYWGVRPAVERGA